VIAWLAGEKWRLDVFETHGKIYEASASAMFHVPIAEITKENPLRQKGKIAELACIAEGQLVLTDSGLTPIEKISINQKIWDGENFVSHDGIIFKGLKKVISYDGLTATPDHLVWIEGQPEPVQFGYAATCGAHLVRSGNGRNAIRTRENNQPGKKMEGRMETPACTNTMHRMQVDTVDAFKQPYFRKIKRLSAMFSTPANTFMVGSEAHRRKTALRKSQRQKLYQLWRPWDSVQILFDPGRRALDSKQCSERSEKLRDRQNRHQRELRKRQYPFHTETAESGNPENFRTTLLETGRLALRAFRSNTKAIGGNDTGTSIIGSSIGSERKTKELEKDSRLVRTYDILNAGPNHRFTVSDVLVHNCGYGGGIGALKAMGALKMGLHEEDLPSIIARWRGSNRRICAYWGEVEEAAMEAVENGSASVGHGIKFHLKKGILFCRLPSGRELAYYKPELRPSKFGNTALCYQGMDQTTKQWRRVDTFGGKLVENIVQAVSRDLLAEAMLRLDKAKYSIVGHVHDEIIIDQRKGSGSLEDVIKIMTTAPTWAKGLPLAADGFESDYYKK